MASRRPRELRRTRYRERDVSSGDGGGGGGGMERGTRVADRRCPVSVGQRHVLSASLSGASRAKDRRLVPRVSFVFSPRVRRRRARGERARECRITPGESDERTRTVSRRER